MHTHIPRKRFGQNFLIDNTIIANIISFINPQPGQHFVEIGPGQGAITQALVASKANIDAVELDRDLAEYLTGLYANCKNFNLHSADILKFPLRSIYEENPSQKLRVVGNLPYNISTPLLFKLFTDINIISDMYFMLQREVAERLTAVPGNKEYGRMSVMAQYYCSMQIVLDVPPTSFNPAPKVDSSIVEFIPHDKPSIQVQDPRLLQTVTTHAFNQRRKTISNALKNLLNSTELQQLNIDPMLRAENLTLAQYAQITNFIAAKNG